ncbi:MAG TPA: sigma-54-dependent Fis family transcriptional regulator [Pararobbsia sp.]|nr:sigma-54-dependent Fis family transcriptional regulator [Pararobbsia sp.]
MIRKSRDRSIEFGLTESMTPDYGVLGAAELVLRIDQNRALCTHARPVMETLYGQIANTHSMVVLTDADGLILHSLGDDDFLRRAEKVALRAGAVWNEQQQGTNAIGTALAEAQATTVYGNQHFLRANHFLACSSVPILDPYGALLGVLDVTGDCRSHHRHTMALAKMSAQMIENHLFASTFTQALRIHFHSRPEFIGTLMEGIAAFRADGTFLSANRSAQFQLGLPLASLHAHTLSSLFNVSGGQLIDEIRASSLAPGQLQLELHNGVRVSASVEFRRAASVSFGVALGVADARAANGATAPAPVNRMSSLQYFDTGDRAMSDVLTRVRKVIGKPIAILIGGETGTGKDMLAAAIHRDSPRANQPFVSLNCSSIPESLIESELFGYVEGAFTGAAKGGRIGKIAEAHRGTLFLDEIGDMPYALQTRLLRVLQERVVAPLGSAKERPVDFKLICATHRNLRERVAAGEFREDLYYRINGLFVALPPLRERTDLEVVINKLMRAERDLDRVVSIDQAVIEVFRQHRWPGNLRQLSNVLRASLAMLDVNESMLTLEHLPFDFMDEFRALCSAGSAGPGGIQPPPGSGSEMCRSLDDVTASTVDRALEANRGNVSAAARMLGVSRGTLYRRMARTRASGRNV